MKTVITDAFAVNPGDLSWDWLKKYGEYTAYDKLTLKIKHNRIRQQLKQITYANIVDIKRIMWYNILYTTTEAQRKITSRTTPLPHKQNGKQHSNSERSPRKREKTQLLQKDLGKDKGKNPQQTGRSYHLGQMEKKEPQSRRFRQILLVHRPSCSYNRYLVYDTLPLYR